MKPFKFLSNRVLRLYTGGSGIDRLRGADNVPDSRYPEDWIASCVEADRRTGCPAGHGLSFLEYGGSVFSFPEFLHNHAEKILGKTHLERYGENPALLTKLLDSAEQLPLQVHPTKADALKYFHTPYGKTEAWIVLATREVNGEAPYLLAGFNRSFDKEVFIRESLEGVYRTGLGMFHRIPVKPGDVIMIRGGLPHAIGPGVTMIEVMEPSDLVVVPETNCCGIAIDEEKRFAGLKPEEAMALFDCTLRSREELLADIMLSPEQMGGGLERLIPLAAADGCFEAFRLTLRGSTVPKFPRRSFRIGIVTEGHARLGGLLLRRGEGFLIPYTQESFTVEGEGKIIFTLPPG